MKIPYDQNLHSQSFNSDFVEYVWRFDVNKPSLKNQIIFKSFKNGDILLEEGVIGEDGEYVSTHYQTSGIISTQHISVFLLDELKKETINYLK